MKQCEMNGEITEGNCSVEKLFPSASPLAGNSVSVVDVGLTNGYRRSWYQKKESMKKEREEWKESV